MKNNSQETETKPITHEERSAYLIKKNEKYNKKIAIILIGFGPLLALLSIIVFNDNYDLKQACSVFGLIIFLIGILKIFNKVKWYKRLIIALIFFIVLMSGMLKIDQLNVKENNVKPLFYTNKIEIGNIIYYDTIFYDVYRCNVHKKKVPYKVIKNKKYNNEIITNYCK